MISLSFHQPPLRLPVSKWWMNAAASPSNTAQCDIWCVRAYVSVPQQIRINLYRQLRKMYLLTNHHPCHCYGIVSWMESHTITHMQRTQVCLLCMPIQCGILRVCCKQLMKVLSSLSLWLLPLSRHQIQPPSPTLPWAVLAANKENPAEMRRGQEKTTSRKTKEILWVVVWFSQFTYSFQQ